MSYGRMRDEARRLREQIPALTAQAEATDAAEDAAQGPGVRGDELPAELHRPEQRLAASAAAKARLEAGRRPKIGRRMLMLATPATVITCSNTDIIERRDALTLKWIGACG